MPKILLKTSISVKDFLRLSIPLLFIYHSNSHANPFQLYIYCNFHHSSWSSSTPHTHTHTHTHIIITTSNMKITVFKIHLNTLIPLYTPYYFISQYLQLVANIKSSTWTEIQGKLYTGRSCFTPEVRSRKMLHKWNKKSPFTTVYFLGVRGLITSFYIVYNYTTSGDMDLQSIYLMYKE